MRDYCDSQIEDMDIDAEGPHVNMGILIQIFHCRGFTALFDKREDVEIKIIELGNN